MPQKIKTTLLLLIGSIAIYNIISLTGVSFSPADVAQGEAEYRASLLGEAVVYGPLPAGSFDEKTGRFKSLPQDDKDAQKEEPKTPEVTQEPAKRPVIYQVTTVSATLREDPSPTGAYLGSYPLDSQFELVEDYGNWLYVTSTQDQLSGYLNAAVVRLMGKEQSETPQPSTQTAPMAEETPKEPEARQKQEAASGKDSKDEVYDTALTLLRTQVQNLYLASNIEPSVQKDLVVNLALANPKLLAGIDLYLSDQALDTIKGAVMPKGAKSFATAKGSLYIDARESTSEDELTEILVAALDTRKSYSSKPDFLAAYKAESEKKGYLKGLPQRTYFTKAGKAYLLTPDKLKDYGQTKAYFEQIFQTEGGN